MRFLPLRLIAVSFVLAALGVTAGASMSPGDRVYLDAAVDAAKWVRASAVKTAAGAAWPADPADPKSAGTTLYSGSPGVVLFLLELHRATGQAEYLEEAKAGADELIARLPSEKQTGLYTGIAGIGFTLGEVHRATKDAKYLEAARSVVGTLESRATAAGAGIQWSAVTDIIGGNAGTGLFLLHAAKQLGEPKTAALARRAADRLIEVGIAEHGGLKWPMDPKFPRLMPNFSHGTAGNRVLPGARLRGDEGPQVPRRLPGGRGVPPGDPLVTRNVKDFSKIPGLRVLSY